MTAHQRLEKLATHLRDYFSSMIQGCLLINNELTIEVKREQFRVLCRALVNEPQFSFNQLVDLCAVDYLHYGLTEWETEQATGDGFSRGVDDTEPREAVWDKPRFAVVYHFLSIAHNLRLRVRVFLAEELPRIDSVHDIWASANWYEREAFDLYGILFNGHPDLRRLLTDYGFIGHPFRKDFPVSGHVEVRYDAEKKRVIYQPVTIEPRVLVPRVIRHDQRYADHHRNSKNE